MRAVTQRELRNDMAAVLREVQSGQAVVVTRNGTPVAELRPLPPRRLVPRATLLAAQRRTPAVDWERFRANLDAIADQGVD